MANAVEAPLMRHFTLLILILVLLTFGACARGPGPAKLTDSTSAVSPSPTPAEQATKLSGSGIESPSLGYGEVQIVAEWEQATGEDWAGMLESETCGEELRALAVAEKSRVYHSDQFSGLLPPGEVVLGETWSIPPEFLMELLSQFHPGVSTDLNVGASGAYGLKRASSPRFMDIELRLHAQFEVADGIYYTPAGFLGNMVVDRELQSVVSFQLDVPTDHPKNLAYEMHVGEFFVGLDYIPKMQLKSVGALASPPEPWTEELTREEAQTRLSREFYAFQQIDWVTPEQATAKALASGKPIFAIAIEGVLDDQSC